MRPETISCRLKSSIWLGFCLALILLLTGTTSEMAWARKPKKGSWEMAALRGNEFRDRARYGDALRSYSSALGILEGKGINDLRRAIVLFDISEIYREKDNFYQAKIRDARAAVIYKKEIESHQLGFEYSSKKPIDFASGSLRPLCYICHENWKVVPILYGKDTGYKTDVPPEDSPEFTHKPGGEHWADQRWYCRDCRQLF